MSKATNGITEYEGALLALVLRPQPVTAYQLFKAHEQSPVTSFNASKGQVYPAIRRLKERELIEARKVAGDGRNSEVLSATEAGRKLVRDWVDDIDPSHIILDDPLRTRMLSLDLLSREEKLAWVARAKGLVRRRAQVVEEYNQSVDVPFQQFAYRSVMEALRVKNEWLDELLSHVASTD